MTAQVYLPWLLMDTWRKKRRRRLHKYVLRMRYMEELLELYRAAHLLVNPGQNVSKVL